MKDYAKTVTTTKDEDGIAKIPYYQYELGMTAKDRTIKLIILAAAALLIASNLAWFIVTKKL